MTIEIFVSNQYMKKDRNVVMLLRGGPFSSSNGWSAFSPRQEMRRLLSDHPRDLCVVSIAHGLRLLGYNVHVLSASWAPRGLVAFEYVFQGIALGLGQWENTVLSLQRYFPPYHNGAYLNRLAVLRASGRFADAQGYVKSASLVLP